SNTFIGMEAGYSNTTGYSNTFIGTEAGYSNTTGYSNTFIGTEAGRSNTTGSYNTFIGTEAGCNNTTGYSNTFIGRNAGYSNTTGDSNTFIGMEAGYSNTTGYSNTFIGMEAGYSNTTGYSNTFIGTEAGYSNTTGSYNTFIGRNAGKFLADGSPNQASSNSVFLGYNTRAAAAGDTNEIVIGAGAIGNGSNSVTLGNENITKTILRGDIGIGTNTPTQTLHIERSVTGAARVMVMIKNTDTSTGSLANLVIYSGASSSYTEVMKNGSEYTGVAGYADMSLVGGTGAGVIIRARNTSGIINFLTGGESFSGNSRMFITSTGDIGISTTTPEFRLDVRGNSCVNRVANADSTNTLRNSFNLVLRGAYWTGSASANRDAAIFHRMLSTAPRSEIVFQIAGIDLAMLRDEIADGETALLIRRNVGGTYSVVRVSMGPPDSGGTGYRVLRVPN
ncbi:MAG: hypothetical protein QXE63_06460, partial [Zestosphaera sp.]